MDSSKCLGMLLLGDGMSFSLMVSSQIMVVAIYRQAQDKASNDKKGEPVKDEVEGVWCVGAGRMEDALVDHACAMGHHRRTRKKQQGDVDIPCFRHGVRKVEDGEGFFSCI